MPGHEGKIETRCPACGARYRVPASGIGHRAHCAKCGDSFRVTPLASQRRPADLRHPPTEDDILRWLNEGSDDEFLAPRPRINSGRDPSHPESHEETPVERPRSVPTETRVALSSDVIDSAPNGGSPLRKTG
ncbi:MAG: MJ0042-type zinc finger domain-containing protein [Phycisphaerae bacterium]